VLILPAIDLRGGQCVRLRQGDYRQETVFDADPVAVARRWVDQGGTYLHIVDLDGAKEGRPVNTETIGRIVAAASVPCQVGGGLRTEAHIAQALELGVDRVVLGTRAVEDADWLTAVCARFPRKVVLGLDTLKGRVALEGWQRTADVTARDLAVRYADLPVAAFLCTDISRDGMLEGPNFDSLAELIRATPIPVLASGGVTSPEDVRRLAGLEAAGCIIGRALYEGRLSLSDAILAAGPADDRQRKPTY
jgi:phosphoribosylformimino-5-aminoimidazole carboxamide ribotide isomerase